MELLTTYAVSGFELAEKLPRGASLSFVRVVQALTDTFFCIRAGGDVEQALIDFGVLHDRCPFPFPFL
jgi:hypothetical protein